MVIVVALGIVFGEKLFGGGEGGLKGDTASEREQYLSSLGLEFTSHSSVVQVTVPKDFDEQFSAYNEMLKESGFDLAPLKGAEVQKCTYVITNRADLGANVNAVLLVCDGRIVAGHLVSVEDGKLHPLSGAQQTILPTDGEKAVSEQAYPTD